MKIGGYFVAASQPMALALFVGLLGLKIRRRTRPRSFVRACRSTIRTRP
ncbi:MAG: hypothetical protein HY736_15500 [Verrucomicrobia bacterium]|nr:hypothetical protein [Verrucomicrobiota bacterium]